jgi:hypothetical protein
MITLLLPLLVMSDPVPIVGRPADFSGAVGGPFMVTMAVDKTEVKLGEPIQLTITISGPGDLFKVKRPDLKNDPEWKSKFVVEDVGQSHATEPNTVKFEYKIRPTTINANELPRVKLTYFNPTVTPASRGWQRTYTGTVEIAIRSDAPRVEIPGRDDWLIRANRAIKSPPDLWTRAGRWWHHLWGESPLDDNPLPYLVKFIESDTYPLAILCARSELLKDPSNVLLQDALDLARSRVALPPSSQDAAMIRPESTWWPGWLFHPTVAIAAQFALVMLVVIWAKSRRRSPTVSRVALVGIGLIVALTLSNHLIQQSRWNLQKRAPLRVLRTDTPLRTGNGPDYTVKLLLPRGAECRQLNVRNGWTQVEFASGLTGWVEDTSLLPTPWSALGYSIAKYGGNPAISSPSYVPESHAP